MTTAQSNSDFVTITSPDKKLVVELCPKVGGGITRFYHHDDNGAVHLFRPYDTDTALSPLNFSSFPLTPFSNRIGNGKLSFAGKTFDVKTPFKSLAHPNHGDGWMLPWTVAEHSAHKITLTLDQPNGEPYRYKAEQVLELEDDQLVIGMTITNTGDEPLPFGTGHHPYFPRTDTTILKVGASKVWMSENMLPTTLEAVSGKWDFRNGKTLASENLEPAGCGDDGSAFVDSCFQDWDGTAEIIWPEKHTQLAITADPIFKNFVTFIPSNNDFFCAEPVTNITDGFNLMEKGHENTGTIILKPNEKLTGRMFFRCAKTRV